MSGFALQTDGRTAKFQNKGHDLDREGEVHGVALKVVLPALRPLRPGRPRLPRPATNRPRVTAGHMTKLHPAPKNQLLAVTHPVATETSGSLPTHTSDASITTPENHQHK